MKPKIRRINLFAGPGAGKSTMAAYLFYELKQCQFNVEYIQEYVKGWAYEGRRVSGFDQVYLFAKQIRMESVVLSSGDNIIITDSPMDLNVAYGRIYGFKSWHCLRGILEHYDCEYPSTNIVLDRGDCPYNTEGRFEDYEQAINVDEEIINYLDTSMIPYSTVRYDDHVSALDIVKESLITIS